MPKYAQKDLALADQSHGTGTPARRNSSRQTGRVLREEGVDQLHVSQILIPPKMLFQLTQTLQG